MLKLEKIDKNFGPVAALTGINLEIKPKKVMALLGPNGAGKTTLMRIICGFLTASKGKVIWMGKEVDTSSVEHKIRIGYLPENNPLYSWMTTSEYLHFVADLKGVEKSDKRITRLIEKCGIADVLTKKIDHLSKGFKQRVGLAAALLGDPQLLVLDEPTSGLDPNQILEIRSLIKQLSKEKAVLLSTHILPEAKALADNIVIINRGEIVLNEPISKVKNLEKKFVNLTT